MDDTKIDDGGYAFPSQPDAFEPGMSLRAWFAGQAMQGILTSARPDNTLWGRPWEAWAAAAIAGADALIAALAKDKT